MRKLFYFLIFSFLVLSITSCSKEVSAENNTANTGGSGSGGNSGSGGTGSSGTSSGNYQPMTVGSYWKYQDSATGSISTLTVTNKVQNISGRSYTAFEDSPLGDTAFFALTGSSYYVLEYGTAYGASASMLFNYLDDAAGINTNWQYTAGQANGFPAVMKTTILERNISFGVQGKTYNNVIHTRTDLSYTMYGTSVAAGSYDFYVAKDIGIIKKVSSIGGMGMFYVITSDLIDYHIN